MMPSSDHVSLDPQHAALLANIAQQTGKSYQQLVADAIDLAFTGQPQCDRKQLSPEERRQNLCELLERMRQLPICHPADGLSGRDHDEILYGPKRS